MAYEQRELQGSLFKNDKKETDKHPDMTGSCLIDGVEYWVSGWSKKAESGKWLSLAFKAKDKQASRKPERQPDRSEKDPWD